MTHVSSSEYCERTLDAIISDGHFLRHTNQLQDKLQRATSAAVNALIKHGVILAPGAIFSPRSDQVSPYCRFNVADLADKRFAAALGEIA